MMSQEIIDAIAGDASALGTALAGRGIAPEGIIACVAGAMADITCYEIEEYRDRAANRADSALAYLGVPIERVPEDVRPEVRAYRDQAPKLPGEPGYGS